MARYTIKDLRILVAEANEKFPRETPNYYGNFDRFCIGCAYGGYQIHEYAEDPKYSSVRERTSGYVSARECAEKFRQYIWEYMI